MKKLVWKLALFNQRARRPAISNANTLGRLPVLERLEERNLFATLTLTTSAGLLGQGLNQGSYSSLIPRSPNDSSYLTGYIGSSEHRGFLSFQNTLPSFAVINSVQLVITTGGSTGSLPIPVDIWDVSTPASTLKNTVFSSTIFNDLGSGQKYGSFQVSTYASGVFLTASLDSSCFASILASRGSYFSLGLDMPTQLTSSHLTFSGTGANSVSLVLNQAWFFW